MHVTCTHCESAYDVDLPESVLNSGRKRLKFRCGVCSQRFIIELEEPLSGGDPGSLESNESAATVAANPPASTSMRLRQEDTEYELADVATLQRWIVERRINPHDQISFDGETWEPVGSRPDLKVFFQVVNQVEQAELKKQDQSSEALPREDTEEANWGSDGRELGGQGGDAFADLRGEESPNGDSGANWDPMDPPNPRFQTDHGFNPSTLRSTVPGAFQEEDTHGHEVPGMGVSAETEPDPKTIALVAPIDPHEVPEPDDFDALFGGPTEIDGMTEEVPYPPSSALPEPFSRHDDGLFPPDEDEEDPYFRAPVSDDFGMVDDGPDLPPVEDNFPTENDAVPPMDDFTQEDSFSGGQTLFSVTDDDFLMDDDDDAWEKEQARANQTRKRGLMAIAGLGLLVLAFQFMGGDDASEEVKDKTASATSEQTETSLSETESPSENKQTSDTPDAKMDSTNTSSPVETNETSVSPQTDADSTPTESSPQSTAKPKAQPTKTTVSSNSSSPKIEVPTSSFNSLVQDGWKYGDRGDYKTAERRFADAVQMKPNSAEALFGLGYAREQLGKTEQAYSHYCMTLKHEASGQNRLEAEGRLKAMGRTCTP